MSTLVKLFRLLYPFLQEFGLKEVNIKAFILHNKTLSYLLATCFLMFVMFIYALEQAHLRMLNHVELQKQHSSLEADIAKKDNQIETLEILCTESNKNTNDIVPGIEESLNELMGKGNEK